MKFHAPLFALASVACLHAADIPSVFEGLLDKDVPVRAQVGVVLPPQEINRYVVKVQAAAGKDPKWFREYSSKSAPGAPLPWDERIGLTKEEYDEYIKLWNKREFKPIEDVVLLLRPSTGDTWTLNATGSASTLTTIRYAAKEDTFRSPNGDLKRIKDIQADPSSILGAWTGQEWKFEEETDLGKVKENLAVGRFTDKKFGLIVYRAQELSSAGTPLLDKSLVIRFPIGKAAAAKDPGTPVAKPATKPAAPKPAVKPAVKPAAPKTPKSAGKN